MEFVINKEDLENALKRINQAEKNGFMYCQPIFSFKSAGPTLDDNVAVWNDEILEKAHPTDGNLDWGRGQSVTRRNKFIDGKLVPIHK